MKEKEVTIPEQTLLAISFNKSLFFKTNITTTLAIPITVLINIAKTI
jgi:hypothetical protein